MRTQTSGKPARTSETRLDRAKPPPCLAESPMCTEPPATRVTSVEKESWRCERPELSRLNSSSGRRVSPPDLTKRRLFFELYGYSASTQTFESENRFMRSRLARGRAS